MSLILIDPYRTTAAPFTPASLPNLSLWLDASDASTFTYSSGSVVSQWNDKSGNNYHATQGTVGLQPTRTGTQNSLSTVVFNGAKAMTCGDVIDVGTSNITIISVAKKTSNVASGVIIGKFKISANAGSWMQLFDRSGGNPFMSTSYKPTGTNGNAAESPTASTAHRVMVSTIDRAAGTIANHADASAAGTGTFTSDSATNQNNAQQVWLGAYRDSADTGFFAGYYLIGEIAEVIVCLSALNTTQRQQAEAYLKAKWATA